MIDFKEISSDGEQWELFARDFLSEQGFFIDVSPDRGPDGGKDIIITEQLKGALGNYEFRWVVSCKHFAHSGRSVTEKDEINIRERLEAFSADGFIGFYSTVSSSGLNSRLTQLRSQNKIKDFKIFDHRLIENHLIRIGFSKILMRYFPNSYANIAPLHLITKDYLPLECEVCGKDLLKTLKDEEYRSILAEVIWWGESQTEIHVEDIYWACKGSCDRRLEESYFQKFHAITQWIELSDLVIPIVYLNWLNSFFEKARQGRYIFSEKAIDKQNYAVLAIAQKAMREMTEKEFDRASTIMDIP